MVFTVQEFRDLVRILEQHPEWRAELRRLVLSEELLALPPVVRELAEAQQRTEQRLGRLEEAMTALAEAQQHTEQRLGRLEEAMTALAEAQQHTEQRLGRLEEAMTALAEAQQRTEQRLGRLESEVGDLKGMALEDRYRERAFAYFSRLVRRIHVIFGDELVALLEEAVGQGRLSEEEADDVARADVVVRGQRREDDGEVYLVVEVSWGVGTGDVERAMQRATLLAHTGVQTLAVVAGQRITPEAAQLARTRQVWQVLDGRVVTPADASETA